MSLGIVYCHCICKANRKLSSLKTKWKLTNELPASALRGIRAIKQRRCVLKHSGSIRLVFKRVTLIFVPLHKPSLLFIFLRRITTLSTLSFRTWGGMSMGVNWRSASSGNEWISDISSSSKPVIETIQTNVSATVSL